MTSPIGAQAPIPKLLEDGRRVYLVNAAAHQKHFDDLARYLSAWGRFTLVNQRAEADLVLTFASSANGAASAVAVPVGAGVMAVGGAARSYVLELRSAADPDPVHLDAEALGLGRNAIGNLTLRLCTRLEGKKAEACRRVRKIAKLH